MVPTKHGLGRGLGALIRPGISGVAADGVCEVDVARIAPNPRQPRQQMDSSALQDLAVSIREHGLIQPLIVTALPIVPDQAAEYQLIAGERRLSAARLAGLERVPVIVRGATPQQMLELALVENIQRADLNPLEEAAAFHSLMEDFGLTQEQVATRVGKNRTTIANSLRLLKLPEPVRAALADGRITEGHARAILAVPEARQVSLLKAVLKSGFSVRQTEEAARRIVEKSQEPSERAASRDHGMPIETRAMEDELRQALGTRVQVFRSREGGRIVIHFYSEEELESIYDRIVNPRR